ncbi:MAG: hypothetical protein LBK05_03670 [Treponema sp.]|jgi:hypothetical protein|nr:hypothetical protein [Treponema sp.]
MKNLKFLWPGTALRAAGILAAALVLTFAACSNPNGGGGGGEEETPVDIDAEDFGPSAVIDSTFDIAGQDDWNAAIAAIQEGGNDKNYILTLTADVTLPGSSTGSTFGSVTGIIVSLRGEKTLQLASGDDNNGSLLRIEDNQALVLRESALLGRSGNNRSLVYVFGSNSSFTMHSGRISGNSTGQDGGGVWVAQGSFTMSGGEISGNSVRPDYSAYGGGVYISYNSSFTMSGGKISGNSVRTRRPDSAHGGGVYICSNSSFTMSGGEISGNSATSTSSSSYQIYGGGVSVDRSSFTMSGGKISGNSAIHSYSEEGNGVSEGGGVSVSNSESSFTMSGGEISGNSAGQYGGGVYVNYYNSNSFSKTGGVIYGSDASAALRNTAKRGDTHGHAVFHSGYYRDATLNAGDNISTSGPFPSSSGQTVGNWTRQ